MINSNLQYLWENGAGKLTKTFSDGTTASILWRGALTNPDTKIQRVESYHYSLFILGYATNFLPSDFYQTYAVDMPKPGRSTKSELNPMIIDQLEYWDRFRNPENGMWCNFLKVGTDWVCGDYASMTGAEYWAAELYHSGTIGWGLITDTARVEAGSLTYEEGKARVLQVRTAS